MHFDDDYLENNLAHTVRLQIQNWYVLREEASAWLRYCCNCVVTDK